MAAALVHNAYGKSQVRLTKVQRRPDRHDLIDWSINVILGGDFAAAYTDGDNRQVVATDTMKNIVYALARDYDLGAPEEFGLILARHFRDSYPQVRVASIYVDVQSWQRVDVDGQPHPHAFVGGSIGERTCVVGVSRDSERGHVSSGVRRLPLLKTTDSAFRGFHRDAFTTLPECDDRIMATEVTAEWSYAATGADWNVDYAAAYRALIESFARHQSLGVQHTLHAMGTAVLSACPSIVDVNLSMPNRHRLLVNLAPIGRSNPNEVFVATDEPFGIITGSVSRSG